MVTRKTPLIVLFLFSIGLASCNKAGVAPGKGQDLVLSPVEQQEVAADNAFTLKLFKNLDSANTTANVNLFASPLSVSFALGMTSNGSNGATLTAMQKATSFAGFSLAQQNSYYNNMITNLPKLDPTTTLNIANSIWYRQGFDVLPQFLQTNSNYYHAEVQALNFNNPSSVLTINNWVNKETNGKIPTIINSISSLDLMYLVNAIYFKSGWKEKFDASKTSKLPFYVTDNSPIQADFMDGDVDYKRYDDNTVHVFELPYANDKYSMVILMPAAGTSVHQLAQQIDSSKWKTWMAGLTTDKSDLKLPKFQFSYGTNLNGALGSLGMGIAFSDDADFSLINPTAKLHISAVIHKAFVAVDESGTTAAAATVVAITATAPANPPPTVIDHPFIFAIREISSGLILFTGTVSNPVSQ